MNTFSFGSFVFTIVIASICIHLMTVGAVDDKLPCRLVWSELSAGTTIPATAIDAKGLTEESESEWKQFVIRFKPEDSSIYIGGRYSLEEGKAFIPIGNENDTETPTALETFEILTNPHECFLSWTNQIFALGSNLWTPVNPSSMLLTLSDSSNVNVNDNFIGRIKHEDEWIPGEIQDGDRIIYVSPPIPDEGEVEIEESFSGFQFLQSYSKGLQMDMDIVELKDDLFGGDLEFMGEDIIENTAQSIVYQTILHEKMMRETFNFTVSETWTSTYSETVTTGFLFWKKSKTTTHTVSKTKTTSIETVDETTVTVSRDIRVPPLTSVKACSVIALKKDFNTRYFGRVKYSSRGMKPAEVQIILINEGLKGSYIENDFVIIDIEGEFKCSLAMSTSFIVTPLDDPQGCDAIKSKIMQRKKNEFYSKVK